MQKKKKIKKNPMTGSLQGQKIISV